MSVSFEILLDSHRLNVMKATDQEVDFRTFERLFRELIFHHSSVFDFEPADLVPRSCFGGSRTKKQGRGEGKGEEETRSGKIRIETSADWLFHNGRESSTRVLFLSLAVPKTRQKSFIELKKIKPTLSDFNRTR